MKTNITFEVPVHGSTVGTVGWLANQPIHININHAQQTQALACWLHIGDKVALVSVHGWDYSTPQYPLRAEGIQNVPVDRLTKGFLPSLNAAFDTTWTDAAWSKVRQLIELARAQFLSYYAALDTAEVEEAKKLSFTVMPKPTAKPTPKTTAPVTTAVTTPAA